MRAGICMIVLILAILLISCEEELPEELSPAQPSQEDRNGLQEITGMDPAEVKGMQITSTEFKDRQDIPQAYTCQGEDLSPQLAWTNIPEGTRSFALSMVDPDAPGRTWHHWLVYNIPAGKTDLKIGESAGIEVVNDFGHGYYGGPCPPQGKHRYIFAIYALDVEDLGTGINMANFFSKVQARTIEKAEITGLYEKK